MTSLRTMTLCLVALTACGRVSKHVSDATHGDARTSPDSGTASTENAPPPEAWAFEHNPSVDPSTTRVSLFDLKSPSDRLTGSHVLIENCLRSQGGISFELNLGFQKLSGHSCVREQTVRANAKGDFIDIQPPANFAAPDDAFAEVQAYYHLSLASRWFRDRGVPLGTVAAIVNAQTYVNELKSWYQTPGTATFVPAGQGGMFGFFGLTQKDGDVLFFTQGPKVDISYDGDVAFHEFTHWVLGPSHFALYPRVQLGLDGTVVALNEALADYFAASAFNDPVIGEYGLGQQGVSPRDLRRRFRCPDHVIGERHHDGEIASGALWRIREAIGANEADKHILALALDSAQGPLSFDVFFRQLNQSIGEDLPQYRNIISEIVADHGLRGCVPLRPHEDFDFTVPSEIHHSMPTYATQGTQYISNVPQTFGLTGTPMPVQYSVSVESTAKQISIEYAPSDLFSPAIPLEVGAGDIHVAVKAGNEPIDWGSQEPAAPAVDAILRGVNIGAGRYRISLSGHCLAKGSLVFQLVNRGNRSGIIKRLVVTQQPSQTSGELSYADCARAP